MSKLTEDRAREMWHEAISRKGWSDRKIALVMFDWIPSMGKTAYRPAPGWPLVADGNNEADQDAFISLMEKILQQGEPFSSRGKRTIREPVSGPDFVPHRVEMRDVERTIQEVMRDAEPGTIQQEQILRAAFVARLPEELRNSIGTRFSSVHPERPTPSHTYTRTGNKPMRARYDLGFGHPILSKGIVGVVELKVTPGSFDQLERRSFRISPADRGLRELERDTLLDDFEKLLDPNLPSEAFRISWFVSNRHGQGSAAEIREWALAILHNTSRKLGLSDAHVMPLVENGWLLCRWEEPKTAIYLAWYRTNGENPYSLVPVWGSIATAC